MSGLLNNLKRKQEELHSHLQVDEDLRSAQLAQRQRATPREHVSDGSIDMFTAIAENLMNLRRTIVKDIPQSEWKDLEVEVE